MKYFFDTEFIDGSAIDLISIAIICEDGREFYGINYDCNWDNAGEWVKLNVLPEIPKKPEPFICNRVEHFQNTIEYQTGWRNRTLLTQEIAEFIHRDVTEIWGWYKSSDWVALYQLFGAMVDLPPHFPRYCLDLKQTVHELGNPRIPFSKVGHHALRDARWLRDAYNWLKLTHNHHPTFQT